MSGMTKTCPGPGCGKSLPRVARQCDGCGHRFSPGKANGGSKKPKRVSQPEEASPPDFAAGPASNGGFVTHWPVLGEHICYTAAERRVIEEALGITHDEIRAADSAKPDDGL